MISIFSHYYADTVPLMTNQNGSVSVKKINNYYSNNGMYFIITVLT